MRKIRIRVRRKPLPYWLPGTDVSDIILKEYGRVLDHGDIIIISDKALSVAHGYIYDESRISSGTTYRVAAYLVSRVLWGRVLSSPFSKELRDILLNTPIDLVSKHKRLALYIGGIKHLVKPVSEAGIDTTNLPHSYVSLPIREVTSLLRKIRREIESSLGIEISILVADTDKTYKVKGLNLAFSTRPSAVRNVIDLGGYAYLLGKYFRRHFVECPTPVAYLGRELSLDQILWLCKAVEERRGYGAGRNIMEMYRNLGVSSYNDITWRKLDEVKHYPVIVARLKFKT